MARFTARMAEASKRREAFSAAERLFDLPVTRFRPGFPLYPRVSELVGVMTDQILNGASTDEALSAYGRALRDLAGSEQVIDVR